ncbi:cystathionine beta-lyase/cystathionine gamma-synthase [Pedobacter sp. AK017]|uniref:trans-sulfuration enzyme family protein n=1 Tax=Pedobacter sp. AK017 TaxID=2723073 RepID=UPI00161CE5A8|nr:aminotransferase class V-fold PLP-dependent enzyme [Pedobacter sp. AK017]MBB5437279.1 cystathionine beta-lyase/cystathionine gamma-synthase [Pedobacter sp. AK017]
MINALHLNSSFGFSTAAEFSAALADEFSTCLYSRGRNPTVDALRAELALLDGAEDCLLFNSGVSAISTAVLSMVKSGDHIIAVRGCYVWTERLFNWLSASFGIDVSFVEGKDTWAFEKAIRPNTRLIYLESPTGWSCELQDLHEVALLARAAGIITLCDNSYSTPLHQQPIKLGIDMAVQSASKYLGGHSDLIGGVLCGSAAMIKQIFEREFLMLGTGMMPFVAWQLGRSLPTLQMRLKQSTGTVLNVLPYLRKHPKIEKVLYPFNINAKQYSLALKQMQGGGGLLTLVMKPGFSREAILGFCERLEMFRMAVSWGGTHSLVFPKCAGIAEDLFDAAVEEHRYVRLYFGLEDGEELLKDLDRALEGMEG